MTDNRTPGIRCGTNRIDMTVGEVVFELE